jgi:hypothetical protein
MSTSRRKRPRGNCYVTCEALYHLMGGKKVGLVPNYMKHEGETHWFLTLDVGHPRGLIVIDPTVRQFRTKPNYDKGRGSGFLTKRPSKRAREMMKRMVWQHL